MAEFIFTQASLGGATNEVKGRGSKKVNHAYATPCQAHFRPQFILIGITASRADHLRTPLHNFNAPPEHGKPTGITETHFKPPPALGLL